MPGNLCIILTGDTRRSPCESGARDSGGSRAGLPATLFRISFYSVPVGSFRLLGLTIIGICSTLSYSLTADVVASVYFPLAFSLS